VTEPRPEDPFVAAEIEQALAPFRDALAPEDLAWLREELARILADDPEARAALHGAHPRVVDESGERVQPGAVEANGATNRSGSSGA
jgi:hypothetical protein